MNTPKNIESKIKVLEEYKLNGEDIVEALRGESQFWPLREGQPKRIDMSALPDGTRVFIKSSKDDQYIEITSDFPLYIVVTGDK